MSSLSRIAIIVIGIALIMAGVVGLVTNVVSEPPVVDEQVLTETEQSNTELAASESNDTASTIDRPEEPYVEEVPERGDPYFEAEASDGSWVSYVNPRDEYRDPYLGDGSGKFCVSLYNADGEVAVGQTAPNTTVTVPTGESLAWHSHADPFVVDLPLTEHYERPLDSDQFGTDPDVSQGDGYLDSHCMEIHGMPADGTVEYGEAEIDGEYEDRVEVIGYIQQDGTAWDSDVDPLADAVSYEEAGGGWTYEPDASHGQMVVVLQLDHGETEDEGSDDGGTDDTEQDDSTDGETSTDTDEQSTDDGTAENAEEGANADDELSGFGLLGAIVAVLSLALYARSR